MILDGIDLAYILYGDGNRADIMLPKDAQHSGLESNEDDVIRVHSSGIRALGTHDTDHLERNVVDEHVTPDWIATIRKQIVHNGLPEHGDSG